MKHLNDFEDSFAFSEHSDDLDFDPSDAHHQIEIKRKLDERLEKRRLKEELEDYEGELDADFDWKDYDKN